jgi:hypothetical protein
MAASHWSIHSMCQQMISSPICTDANTPAQSTYSHANTPAQLAYDHAMWNLGVCPCHHRMVVQLFHV